MSSKEKAFPSASLENLASSDSRLRRLAFRAIFVHLSESSTPLTYGQCMELWRSFFEGFYMHDSNSMTSVQTLATNIADQFLVIAKKDARKRSEGNAQSRSSQIGDFSEAFWETMAMRWHSIDVYRMDKILLLIRLVMRSIFQICLPLGDDEIEHPALMHVVEEQCAIFAKWPLSPRERKVPDGLRYHLLDIWIDELYLAFAFTRVDLHDDINTVERKLMEPVEKLAKDGLTKSVRTRAKETFTAAEPMKLRPKGSKWDVVIK